MEYSEMTSAIKDAETTIRRAEMFCNQMAKFLVNRLRKVYPSILWELKKELQDFNMKSQKWK